MKEKTCMFTGHRTLPERDEVIIKKHLEKEVEKLILEGIASFLAGGALGFDTLCAETILKLKEKYPYIQLILILPCENQTRGWIEKDIQKYQWIKSQADTVKILSPHYYRDCMHARNRHLVEQSAYCICYLIHSTGGTAYTVEYAAKNGVQIIPIFPAK